MDGNNQIFFIIIGVCIIMSAYFSATETAFSSLNKIRLKNMADKGNLKAAKVLKMAENYDSLLSTILIGNNIVNIASASLATVLFVDLMGEDIGTGMSTLVMTIVVLIFGEVSPKSIVKEMPEAFAMFSSGLLSALLVILAPFNFLFRQWKKVLSKIIRPGEKQITTEEELLTFVEETKKEGGIDEQESSMIKSVIDFSDIEVLEVLTPRIDVVGVTADATKEEIAEIFRESGYSRVPVSEIVNPAFFVSGNKKIRDLLKELQSKKLHIAVVIDEYGGTIGIVTMEDILEELVGEIWDEHDEIVDEITMVSESEYLVTGNANVEKLFGRIGIDAEVDATTVTGWVMDNCQKIPKQGDEFVFRNLEVKVLEMDGKRVGRVSARCNI